MREIIVDFSKTVKKMKAVNGVNSAPYSLGAGADQRQVKECFQELHIPYSRTHDCMGRYGGMNYIDVPNVFRNFDADETDENNYDFHYSDEFLLPIIQSGAQVVYRLGITIEWGTKKYRTAPPKDMAKWARICEHIILHYNYGWANGFHFGIAYWEIWNEPENPPMWSGTKEEFFNLYRVSAGYLKEKFPEIKIGGYGSCGFYAITCRPQSSFFQGCLAWFKEFLQMVVDEKLPLDFFSWHLYTDSVEEFLTHAQYVRKTLNEYGLTQTESHFSEWNIGGEGAGFHLMRNMSGASYVLKVLCEMQNRDDVDKAMYYSFDNAVSGYNGLFDQNLLYCRNGVEYKTCTYYALKAFGDCYALGEQVYAKADEEKLGVVAARNEGGMSAAIANYHAEEETYLLRLCGLNGKKKILLSNVLEKERVEREYTVDGDEFTLPLTLPTHSVVALKALAE